MTLMGSETVKRGRHRLRFCVGKSLSLYYCSFNMKLCSCGDLVLLTSVSLQRTIPPALWMIYIHGKWQPEQESEDVILSQTGNKASSPTFIPFTESAVISPAGLREQSSHITVVYPSKTTHACKDAVEIYREPVKYAENRKDWETASGIAHRPSEAKS